ncbi:MAG: hypothetical protein AB8H86_05830 [Polyangiales bacterium]
MSIEESLRKLSDSRPAGQEGGFVVFSWGDRFIQFALLKSGVAFNWPNPPATSPTFDFFTSRVDAVKAVLTTLGFAKVDRISQAREFEEVDGIDAQCGHDVALMVTLTHAVLREVLQLEDVAPSETLLELY